MYFHESEAIASEHRDLRRVIERIDKRLCRIHAPAILRPSDMAYVVGADENQAESVFELLEEQGVLIPHDMVECDSCQNLMSASDFQQAVSDEDPFECTVCGQEFSRRLTPVTVYRMSADALERTRAVLVSSSVEPDSPAQATKTAGGIDVDSSTFTIRAKGRSHTFSGRSKLLFLLFERINRRPGHQVPFDTLRQKNDVWDGLDVDDSTIRGAVGRLKKVLRAAGMGNLAAAISTGRFQGRPYVILDPSKLKSN